MGIFGGSLGKWWKQAEEGLSSGGEFGKFTKSLKQTSDYITDADYIGGSASEIFHASGQNDLNRGLANLDRTTMGWSRQASPFWEGGMTGSGGTFRDIFGNEDEGGLIAGWAEKGRHHIYGDEGAYGKRDSGGGGDSAAVVAADTEDPSLINQGDWKRANSIESFLRREDQVYKAGLFHDRAKTQRGRLSATNLS